MVSSGKTDFGQRKNSAAPGRRCEPRQRNEKRPPALAEVILFGQVTVTSRQIVGLKCGGSWRLLCSGGQIRCAMTCSLSAQCRQTLLRTRQHSHARRLGSVPN